jgi:CRISPR system Cascade subunit CasA
VYDLLVDAVVSVRKRGGSRFSLSIPDVFAALACDEIEGFPALRPHQAPAWHAFLVQVGALSLHRAGVSELPTKASDWMTLLAGLTAPHSDTAWSLVVDDPTRPALLQAPVVKPEQFENYKTVIDTPDALDLLVTSKNHDVKSERMAEASPEHWLYALVTLQTFEGVMGAGGGKYGIARMNGGFGSRPMLGVVPRGGPGLRFSRDIIRLLAARPAISSRVPGLGTKNQVGLMWLVPWDGNGQLTIEELDPFFVEICRRVRLAVVSDSVIAVGVRSKVPRIAVSKEMKGVTGDPWAPIARDDNKVLSITGDGFGYARMVDLQDRATYERPPLAEVDQGDAAHGLTIDAVALARGQGKTEGFHTRRIPISNTIARRLIGREATDRLAALGRARVNEVGGFARSVLRPSLFMLFQGGPDEVNYGKVSTNAQVGTWMKAFDTEIDRVFFDDLFAEFDARELNDLARADIENRHWREKIRELGLDVFNRAMDAAPRNASRWHRARARSRSFFQNRARDVLGLAATA